MNHTPEIIGGIPYTNKSLFHKMRFAIGDSAVWIGNLKGDGKSLLFVRDIEMSRARAAAAANDITCSAEYVPEGGLSGDRDTALAQAVAECFVRHRIKKVKSDRSLPYIFAWHIQQRGIEIAYSPELGTIERRVKSNQEIEHLTKAQEVTAKAMTMACEWIATSNANKDGILFQGQEQVSSESVKRKITQFLINEGFSTPSGSIVATVPHVADCHHFGTGPLKTGLPIIVDIFPKDDTTHYNGDCTRTVVHGDPDDIVLKMHKAVVGAKKAGCEELAPGTTGENVHKKTIKTLFDHGFDFRRGSANTENSIPAMRHGTGHGIGLDVHEPILLDDGGGKILPNEVFTVEPGLYSTKLGGVRVEDMVQVTESGHKILCELHEGLFWK